MLSLDLRDIRCPLALILLKQRLHILEVNSTLTVLFSHADAMQDIKRYLNKKKYSYVCEQNSLLITLYSSLINNPI